MVLSKFKIDDYNLYSFCPFVDVGLGRMGVLMTGCQTRKTKREGGGGVCCKIRVLTNKVRRKEESINGENTYTSCLWSLTNTYKLSG